MTTDDKPDEKPAPAETVLSVEAAIEAEAAASAQEEFPEKLFCPQCRRMFPVKSLRAKANTLLTEAALVCPRCRRKLRRMKLKDWYDHYVQGQAKSFTMDTHGFVHNDPPGEGLNAPNRQQDAEPRDMRPPQRQGQGQGQGPRDRRGGPNRGRDNRPNQRNQQNQSNQQNSNQKRPRLPQVVKAYRLPKKRRSR